MKKVGFKNHHAGAIEAIASTGGQVMPPIMGAGVFILATLTETEYLKIAGMNVIPAVLFFTFIMLMVDLEAVKSGLKGLPPEDVPDFKKVLKRGWHFFIPLIIVITLLFNGFSPDYGAFWGIVSTLVLSWRNKETAMGPKDIFIGLIKGAQSNAAAGAAIGSLGIIIGGIILLKVDEWFKGNEIHDEENPTAHTEINYVTALKIGFFQCLAMAGQSRSGIANLKK